MRTASNPYAPRHLDRSVERLTFALHDRAEGGSGGGGGASAWRGAYAHSALVDFEHTRRQLLQLHRLLDEAAQRGDDDGETTAAAEGAAEAAARALAAVFDAPWCSCTGGFETCSGSVPYSECPGLFEYALPPQVRIARRLFSGMRHVISK